MKVLSHCELTQGCGRGRGFAEIIDGKIALTTMLRVLRKINAKATNRAGTGGNVAGTAAWFTNRCWFGFVVITTA
jgi:hypothetical protein